MVKTCNKKESSFLVLNKYKGQYSDVQKENDEESEECHNDIEDSSEDEDEEYEGFGSLKHDVVCSIQDEAAIPKGWILMDSQSMVILLSNEKLLTNICNVK